MLEEEDDSRSSSSEEQEVEREDVHAFLKSFYPVVDDDDDDTIARNVQARSTSSSRRAWRSGDSAQRWPTTTTDYWATSERYQTSGETLHHATPRLLVSTLAEFPDLSASLQELEYEKLLEPSSVEETISNNGEIFSFNGTLVKLKPQIGICSAYSKSKKCKKNSCNDVHICPKFVKDGCSAKNCKLSHSWCTDHNKYVLSRLFLEHLMFITLQKIFRSSMKKTLETVDQVDQLDVCHGYISKGCDLSDCEALHVCLSILVGLQKCPRDCQLNHDLLSPDCSRLLRAHGLSTNEAPRDIVMALLTHNPTLAQYLLDNKTFDTTWVEEVMKKRQSNSQSTKLDDCTENKNPKDATDSCNKDEDSWASQKDTEHWQRSPSSFPGQPQQQWSRSRGSRDQEEDNWRRHSGCNEPPRYNWNGLYSYKNTQYDEDMESVQLTPRLLVDYLVGYPKFSANLLELLEDKDLFPTNVQNIALKYKKTFSLNNGVVELKPQVKICAAHSSPQGCWEGSLCTALHICPGYVTNSCPDKMCTLGHKWLDKHNKGILQLLFIDWLPSRILAKLLQPEKKSFQSVGRLNVCRGYNEGFCNRSDCGALHVCMSFVLGLSKCSVDDCQLNHNLQRPDCCQLLRAHGLPTNERQRNIVVALISANPSLSREQQSADVQDKKNKVKVYLLKNENKIERKTDKNTGKGKHKASVENYTRNPDKLNANKEDTSTETKCFSDESKNQHSILTNKGHISCNKEDHNQSSKSGKHVSLLKDNAKLSLHNAVDATKTKSTKIIHATIWSHNLEGNVPIPEICYYSVKELCKYEGSGCQRLHSTRHFHWQVSVQGSRWLNLGLSQVICLEKAYCDPSHEGVDLPQHDAASLDMCIRGLHILMGQETWHANFREMILTNSLKTTTLHIRRLCTEAVSGQIIKPSCYVWYFLDNYNSWIPYGKADTSGQTHFVSNITSDHIENHYLQNPSVPLIFKNSKFAYILNFTKMVQINKMTKTSRPVIRRPEAHLPPEMVTDQNMPNNPPSHWDAMQPGEQVRLVTLSSLSTEYQTVVKLLSSKIPTSSLVEIKRIQNPCLWQAFQNKVKQMVITYGSDTKVDLRQLFHDTRPEVVATICHENFDWRLRESKIGRLGRGSYFSTNANYSYKFCSADSDGKKYLIMALVAVGCVTPGRILMTEPPINYATGLPFDSYVNNEANPSIIVKHDKRDCYPDYIIVLK
ncbi:uncharacterized protein [Procambarus clarkii]|uniref:uncharacterized protein n=1 Tax=Procambarus clarkii TaxID=6728 RepID=UPI001E6789BF|nr:uncharacterized protein LOC123744889 [Procambarus clarkii]XP_045581063.1 uncharacterized protein LOC123744889 [Procambarus clarkii]